MTRQQWLAARQKGIGASDAACIIGVNPWKTNLQLWEEKTGRSTPEDIGEKPQVVYGKNAEDSLRSLFALDYPQYKVSYDEFGMIANRPEEPWLFATLDGELEQTLYDDGAVAAKDRYGVLEIKTTEIMHPRMWEEWSDGVPQHYYCQVLHQLLATGYSYAILKAQIRYRDYKDPNPVSALRITTKHYYIDARSEQVRADMAYLLAAEKKYWLCVQNDTPPPLILPNI